MSIDAVASGGMAAALHQMELLQLQQAADAALAGTAAAPPEAQPEAAPTPHETTLTAAWQATRSQASLPAKDHSRDLSAEPERHLLGEPALQHGPGPAPETLLTMILSALHVSPTQGQQIDRPTDEERRRPHPLPEPQPERDAETPELLQAPAEAPAPPDWRHTLVAALLREARTERAQGALHAAATQWLRGRCVLLACPQDASQPERGWACVLWRAPAGEVPVLRGERFPALLRWAPGAAPHATPPRWWAVRAVKNHQPPRGRQLSTLTELAPGRVSCEVQLGAALPAAPRWQELCIRIDTAQRLWAALGSQWSVHVLACNLPLMHTEALA